MFYMQVFRAVYHTHCCSMPDDAGRVGKTDVSSMPASTRFHAVGDTDSLSHHAFTKYEFFVGIVNNT